MQRTNPLLALVVVALTAFATAAPLAPAAAQGAAPQLVIAVLDGQRVMRESSAAKSIQAEVERQREAFQADLAQQEKTLRAADQKLSSERTTLSQEAFAQRRQELEQQAAQLRRNVQGRKEQLENIVNGGLGQIRQALVEVVAEIAKARGITLVLNKSQVILAVNDFDITDEVMQRLNARLPKVSLAAPK